MVGPLQNAHLGPFPLEKCSIILGTLIIGGYNLFAEIETASSVFPMPKLTMQEAGNGDCT